MIMNTFPSNCSTEHCSFCNELIMQGACVTGFVLRRVHYSIKDRGSETIHWMHSMCALKFGEMLQRKVKERCVEVL